jgi:ubiquinone/menaquinone biosynthesis C-methylase UbiE
MRMPSGLRRLYMRLTTPSMIGAGSRGYVRWFYAVWSRFYDWSVGLDRAYGDNARRMVDLTVDDGDRVIDVGIGTGLLAGFGAHRASHWTGVDYSGAMLSRAAVKMAARRLGNVTLQWGDARELPYADGQFEAAVSSFVLPHFAPDEKVEVLREMARVLRPGGRLGLFLAQGEVAPLFSTRAQLERALADAGFVDAQFEDRDDVYRIVNATRAAPK